MRQKHWYGLIQLMRPKQWLKNAFVLAPLIFAGSFLHAALLFKALAATCLFCITASVVYIVNDLHDIEMDRLHPGKLLTRPLAAGVVTPSVAIKWLVVLCALLLYGFYYLPAVIIPLGLYLVLNLLYTFFLKNQPVTDIFIIAFGFVLRVYAGAAVLQVPISSWMLVTTLCLALYLAAIKRRQEILQTDKSSRNVLKYYTLPLINRYAEMSATGALIFYSLFVMTQRTQLIISIPVVLFGLFRYWYIVEILDEGESPTDALFSDWPLLLTVLVWVVICIWALWPKG